MADIMTDLDSAREWIHSVRREGVSTSCVKVQTTI
ncbi:hypothetical protein RsTz2092_11560 [Deferribacterales bacterium RsTz2092]